MPAGPGRVCGPGCPGQAAGTCGRGRRTGERGGRREQPNQTWGRILRSRLPVGGCGAQRKTRSQPPQHRLTQGLLSAGGDSNSQTHGLTAFHGNSGNFQTDRQLPNVARDAAARVQCPADGQSALLRTEGIRVWRHCRGTVAASCRQ